MKKKTIHGCNDIRACCRFDRLQSKTSNQQSDNTGKTPVATSTGKEFREGISIRYTKTALKHKASGGFFGFIRGICF